jgi:AraC-like DNA-binding protein
MALQESAQLWKNLPIAHIEDLRDGVLGAGLEATQMSSTPVSGNLLFAQHDRILYGSGQVNGKVSLQGPLSTNHLTVGIGLRLGPGTRHWLEETFAGVVGVFHGGDEHDAFYTSGSMYATATLSLETLEELAAHEGFVLDRPVLGGTGLHRRPLPPGLTERFANAFARLHVGQPRHGDENAGKILLLAIIHHIAREPISANRLGNGEAYARIVRRARNYILEHLARPISPEEIATACFTSRRTLFRAFADILDETPQGYVRRLRLHRIRYDLASYEERNCTIALIANNWGISELGRMAGWYGELFGERPSDTLSNHPTHPRLISTAH